MFSAHATLNQFPKLNQPTNQQTNRPTYKLKLHDSNGSHKHDYSLSNLNRPLYNII